MLGNIHRLNFHFQYKNFKLCASCWQFDWPIESHIALKREGYDNLSHFALLDCKKSLFPHFKHSYFEAGNGPQLALYKLELWLEEIDMMSFGSSFCPQCSSEIPVNRLQSTPVICPDCGWSQNTKEVKLHNYLQSKTIKVFLAFSIFISLGYFHSIKWGAHSFKVIPLQLNILTGNTHVNTFKNMAQICSNRQLHSCAAENLELASKIEPNNLELLAQLSTTLHKTNQKEKALAAYSRYFSQQGRDLDLAFHFANLLVEKGNYKEAKTYYEYILNAKPNIFQITVSHKYVHLLMKMGENKLARNFIFKIRKQGENATLFMNNELKEMAKL